MFKPTPNVFRLFAAFASILYLSLFLNSKSSSASSRDYIIMVKHSGQCLNILGASKSNGASATQGLDCGGTPNFLWTFRQVGYNSQKHGTIYNIIVKHSGQCLNVLNRRRENGAPVVQGRDCTTPNFRWYLAPTSNDGFVLIINEQTGGCLNVLGASKENGARVVQGYACDTDNFKWGIRLAN